MNSAHLVWVTRLLKLRFIFWSKILIIAIYKLFIYWLPKKLSDGHVQNYGKNS